MKKKDLKIEEIENFVDATVFVIDADQDDIFPIQPEEFEEIGYRDSSEDGDGNINFTEDIDVALEIFEELSSKLDSDALDMYYALKDNDEFEGFKKLKPVLEMIKKNLSEKESKTDKEDTKGKDKKTDKGKKEKEKIKVKFEDILDFYVDLNALCKEDSIILSDESLIETKVTEGTAQAFFDELRTELNDTDTDYLPEKSRELWEKISGKEIIIIPIEKKKSKDSEKAEDKPEEKEETKSSKKDKVEKIEKEEKKTKKTEKKVEKEEVTDTDDGDDEDEKVMKIISETKSEKSSGCSGNCTCSDTKSSTLTISPKVDKGFVTLLKDIVLAIENYQGV
jgi:hypothetical protein